MAYTTVITVTHAGPVTELGRYRLGVESGLHREAAIGLATMFEDIASGRFPSTVEVQAGGTASVRASGTLTMGASSGAVGGTIGGTLKTVTWATSNTASCIALAAAINADATIGKLVYATASGSVVTLTAMAPGPVGNKITLVASGTGVTASGATLTAGAGQDVAPVSYNRG